MWNNGSEKLAERHRHAADGHSPTHWAGILPYCMIFCCPNQTAALCRAAFSTSEKNMTHALINSPRIKRAGDIDQILINNCFSQSDLFTIASLGEATTSTSAFNFICPRRAIGFSAGHRYKMIKYKRLHRAHQSGVGWGWTLNVADLGKTTAVPCRPSQSLHTRISA